MDKVIMAMELELKFIAGTDSMMATISAPVSGAYEVGGGDGDGGGGGDCGGADGDCG